MATFTITTAQNIDELTAKAGGDTYNVNGGTLTIDQDSRYGLNQTTSTSLGPITISASLGGTVEIDARYVRLIPFNTGTGTVPASNTVISQGSASGKLIGVYASLTSAPTAAAAAMPASGYIKIKQWNSVAFAAGALTGISASATGADTTGWIELVGDEAATITAVRLGLFRVRGAWYDLGTTTGANTGTYQVPTNGLAANLYMPGVWVQKVADISITGASYANGIATYTVSSHALKVGEQVTVSGITPSGFNVSDGEVLSVTSTTFTVAISDPGSAYTSGGVCYSYEFYPCAGSLTATSANMATDIRGKVCWYGATTGLFRFQHDGTNSTGGYLPPSGLRLRIANIFMQNCTTAARTANALPNATLATRYDFTATGGVVSIDKCMSAWFLSFAQSYNIQITNTATFEQILVSELASAVAWNNIGVGQCAAQAQYALSFTTCLAGGTIKNCWFSRATLAANYVTFYQDVNGFSHYNVVSFGLVARAAAATGNSTLLRAVNCSWTNCTLALGRQLITTCTNLTYTNTHYWDHPATTTATANPMNLFDLASSCSNILVDGVDFLGLTLMQPYSSIMNVGAAGCDKIKLRNCGTYAAPLDLGGARVDGASWTRVTTTATVTTASAHGLKTGDIIYCIVSSDVAAITVATKTITVSSTTVFTFTCLNAGAASGTLSYYPTMTAAVATIAANAVASNVKVQRCYCPHTRTTSVSEDNSSKGIFYENVQGDYINAPVTAGLNERIRNLWSTHAMTAQTNPVYGSHWFDCYTGDNSTNLASQSWSRTTTTATVTSNNHKLRTGELILVTVSSDTAAIVLGSKSVTVTGANTFTFTCLNAGGASGTLTYENLNGRIGLLMNEASAQTSTQYTIDSGTPSFTAAGGLYAPTVNQQITFEMPGINGLSTGLGGYLKGPTGFSIMEAVMAGGGALTNFDITYAIDKNDGAGYSSFKNLSYPRAGGGGANASTTVTMTSTTGVAVNDYVFGTNIAPLAKVVSVDSATNITVSIANVGAVSGILRFNQLPNETIATPANGIKLKIRIKTTTANTTAITSLYVLAKNTETSRAYTHTLDTATLSLTGLVSGSDIVLLQPGTSTEIINVDNNSGSTWSYDYDTTDVTSADLCIYKSGYAPYTVRNLSLGSGGQTLPVAQVADRNYSNP